LARPTEGDCGGWKAEGAEAEGAEAEGAEGGARSSRFGAEAPTRWRLRGGGGIRGRARGSRDPSTLCAVRCALCAVRCALCAVRCALCAVRCALCADRVRRGGSCTARMNGANSCVKRMDGMEFMRFMHESTPARAAA